MMASVLVVEDELPMRRVLRSAIDSQGYRVWEAGSVSEALSAFSVRAPNAILLDLGLPDGEGFEVVTRIRELSDVPIVVISARGGERDQVRALDAGANDYVTKPFREGELLARLRAALRSASRQALRGEMLTIGSLRVEMIARRVFVNDAEVELTPTEFRLLEVLARDAGRVVTHKRLLREVWGEENIDDVQYLRVYMKQLRQKLEEDPANPRLLTTALGVGYRLRVPE